MAAPPEDRPFLDDIVEPGLADFLGREVRLDTVVFKRTNEGKSAGHVVIGDDERLVQTLMHVVFDRAEFIHDLLVSPSLEGAAEIDADEFAEDASIDTFEIIVRKSHCSLHRLFEKIAQPLTEPPAMPSMKRLCMKTKSVTTGTTMMRAAAMISPQSELYWPESRKKAMTAVMFSCF